MYVKSMLLKFQCNSCAIYKQGGINILLPFTWTLLIFLMIHVNQIMKN